MSDVFRELYEEDIDAHCPYPKHKGFRGAFRKGWLEGVNGKDGEERRRCPYIDDGETFSTAYARSWTAGYRLARTREQEDWEVQVPKPVATSPSREVRVGFVGEKKT